MANKNNSTPLMYKANSVRNGYDFWVRKLTEMTFERFEWTGLPEEIPVEELEKRLIKFGVAAFVKIKGTWYVVTPGLSGTDPYYRPTTITWSAPKIGSGRRTIGDNCFLIYNDSSDETSGGNPRGLWTLIERYAAILAHIDTSLNVLTVNGRASTTAVAKSHNVANSLKEYHQKLVAGEYDVVLDKSLFDNVKTVENTSPNSVSMSDLLNERDVFIRAYMSEVGVKTATRKAERMLTDEIAADNDVLEANTDDLVAARNRGGKRGKPFGLSISCRYKQRESAPAPTSAEPNEEGDEEDEAF